MNLKCLDKYNFLVYDYLTYADTSITVRLRAHAVQYLPQSESRSTLYVRMVSTGPVIACVYIGEPS